MLGVLGPFAEEPPAPIRFTNYATVQVIELGRTADLNGDGLFDLLALQSMRPYWNTGSNFLNGPTYNYTRDEAIPLPFTFGDFDNDSDLDLFFTRRTEMSNVRRLTLVWNTGKNSFTNAPLASFPSPLYFGTSAATDFDNDGDLDIVMMGNTNYPGAIGRNKSRLLENFGGGNFGERRHNLPGFEDGAIAAADYDNDGDNDLLVCGYTTNSIRARTVLFRNDAGEFVESGIPLMPIFNDGPVQASAVWGDYDNDGDLDLLLAGATDPSSTRRPVARICRNDGNTFTEVSIGTLTTNTRTRANWADFDADGDLDIFTQSHVFENQGDGSFADRGVISEARGQVHVGFFNADRRPDILALEFDFYFRFFQNITARTNAPPSAPTNLHAVQLGNSVSFTWNSSVDLEQTNSLSYNLRIGTVPGGSEVFSAMSNPTNGALYVAQLGNTSLRTNWTIHRFATGTYFWSVQAIDHGFAASEFATEQSFTISNAPPLVEAYFVSNITATAAVIGSRLNPNGAPTEFYVELISNTATNVVLLTTLGQMSTNLQRNMLIPGLNASTTYQARLVASNGLGMSYSTTLTFTTAVANLFTEIPTAFPILGRTTVLPVDVDQDGDLDILNSGTSNTVHATRVWTNDTSIFRAGAVVQSSNDGLGSSRSIDAAGDFNNDSAIDLILATRAAAGLFLNTRTNFKQMASIPSAGQDFIYPADTDNDGDLDLLTLLDILPQNVKLHLNDNRTGFRWPSTIPGTAQAGEWADFDNDGDHDFLIFGATNLNFMNPAQAATRILRNHGENVFSNLNANLPGTLIGAAWADHDNDHDLDLFILANTNSATFGTNSVKLFGNEPNGFVNAATIVSDADIVALHPVDFDHDGLIDVVIQQDLTTGDRLRYFRNIGDETFEEQNLGLVLPGTHFQASFADFDGDHLPDIVLNTTTNRSQFRLRLFRNNLVSSEPLPPVPIQLTSQASKTHATLQWSLPESQKTVAYTYNLRVGKTPGGSEIMSAHSHPITGARYVAQRGNAGQGNTWTVRDLPPGTYFWAVQTVDHAFNASRFSAEATFVIDSYERTPRFVSATLSGHLDHVLTIDAPIRSAVLVETTLDLQNWEPAFDYLYIGTEPVTVPPLWNDTRFYRFRLLE